jgi:hypothetical protein
MIPFQIRTFWRLLTTRGPMEPRDLRAAWHRLRFLFGFPAFELVNAAHLALDRVLFRFTDIPVRSPIFIISSPRSGSTMLHRILALDGQRFTAFRLWQSIFPSLSTQLPVRWLARWDERRGGGLRRRLDALQDRLLGNADRFHKIRLTEVEEDEVILIHACASELLANAFPIFEIFKEYRYFDTLPEKRRHALMGFYKACVQRHLWLEGRERRFLSKNPPFCHKVGSLYETFEDARFVFLVRNPVETICSLLSMLDAFRGKIGLQAREGGEWAHRRRDPEAIRFAVDCYRNALTALDRLPREAYVILRYEDLVASPKAAVEHIYAHFGIAIDEAFRATLEDEERKAKAYRSRHHYAPEDFGLTHAQIEEMADFVYARFGYPRVAAAG